MILTVDKLLMYTGAGFLLVGGIQIQESIGGSYCKLDRKLSECDDCSSVGWFAIAPNGCGLSDHAMLKKTRRYRKLTAGPRETFNI